VDPFTAPGFRQGKVIVMWEILMRNIKMAGGRNHRGEPVPVSNYSAAIARAVEWLGDRYLLAKPIKAAPGRAASETTHADS
jgi:hypothetical protein